MFNVCVARVQYGVPICGMRNLHFARGQCHCPTGKQRAEMAGLRRTDHQMAPRVALSSSFPNISEYSHCTERANWARCGGRRPLRKSGALLKWSHPPASKFRPLILILTRCHIFHSRTSPMRLISDVDVAWECAAICTRNGVDEYLGNKRSVPMPMRAWRPGRRQASVKASHFAPRFPPFVAQFAGC